VRGVEYPASDEPAPGEKCVMNSLKTISVAVVEDDAGLRASVCAIVDSAPDMRCVGSFESTEQALKPLGMIKPAVVLVDFNLPGDNGARCVDQLSKCLPRALFIMLTVSNDPEVIFESLASGAVGYLRKPMEPAELLHAIRDACGGGAPMSSSIARMVIQAFRKPGTSISAEVSPDSRAAVMDRLAPRERQVLELLARGFLQKEIADQLGISFSTVRTLTGRIYEKLHVHSRSQAVSKYFGNHP
jgi:DNA-binding NarL/FixJ family response regulator